MHRFLVGAMLILFPIVAVSQEVYRSGDWVVHNDVAGLQVANVSTSTGATAGIICFLNNRKCLAYLYSGNSCDVGATVPMMINSAVGAFHISTVCKEMPGNTSEFVNVLNEFDNAKEAFESGGDVGFVLPLKSGEFRALRFSTRGAVAAIRAAMTPPSDAKPTSHGDDKVF